MSRREEVEAKLLHTAQSDWPSADEAAEYRHLSLTLADEVDARDAIIDKLLAMMKESADSECYCEDDDHYPIEVCERHDLHARACEIGGRVK